MDGVSSLYGGVFTALTSTGFYGGALRQGGGTGAGAAAPGASTIRSGAAEADVFAAEIARRVEAGTVTAEGAEKKDPTDLENALAGAVDFIRENFGAEAATASMALVMQTVSGEGASEEQVGSALLSVLRFVDRNFGFAAGDRVMAEFNGDLNEALNRYFENGFEETFYASDGSGGSGGLGGPLQSSLDGLFKNVTERFGQDAAETVSSLIEDNLAENGLSRESFKTGLDAAVAWLAATYGTEVATSDLTSDPATGAATPAASGLQAKGRLLDIAA